MNFKKLKSQSGRSMVEMLGVLAIIGVLSVGGIAGYTLSVRKHRANQVIDIAGKYGLAVYTRCQKKILDGVYTVVEDCQVDDFRSSVAFENMGIGNLPVGVTYFGFNHLNNNELTGGIDAMTLSARFDDDKLCQAVGVAAGSRCNDGSVSIPIDYK